MHLLCACIVYIKRLIPFFILFYLITNILRLSILILEYPNIRQNPYEILISLLISFIYDFSVFTYLSILIILLLYLWPKRALLTTTYKIFFASVLFIFNYILLLVSLAEWLFWEEFSSRFNFIAVDYLIYTHEVIGNIKESYPILPLLISIAIIAAIPLFFLKKFIIIPSESASINKNLFGFVALLAAPIMCFIIIDGKIAEISQNRHLNEISKNGIYEFFSAFRHNQISYEKFYLTKQEDDLLPILVDNLTESNATFIGNGITRNIKATGTEKNHNIILITVESLSADYLEYFGNTHNLTPYINSLAKESLFFTNLYAIGTRTVYGLAAITLSIPPIPGNSIIRRPDNENLFSLASVLNIRGYISKFIYGGYGYFDNMNYFFANNGYQIIDRSSLSNEEITFANIWGICDEDLFNRVLKESNASYQQGKPFFNMVMTTSNHRPFTYPDDKIDIPSHTGREGGVKYTDYAIGQFFEKAKQEPWFDNTIFVIIADHTAGSAGKIELEAKKYHIPLIIYAPKIVQPKIINKFSSQIDLAPTLLGILNFSYSSRFYGKNILLSDIDRAFISTYQKIGYITPKFFAILKPIREVSHYRFENDILDRYITEEISDHDLMTTISYFQMASEWKKFNKNLSN